MPLSPYETDGKDADLDLVHEQLLHLQSCSCFTDDTESIESNSGDRVDSRAPERSVEIPGTSGGPPSVRLLMSSSSAGGGFQLGTDEAGCSWADIMDAKEDRERSISLEDGAERGRKLFVGNASFWDLLSDDSCLTATADATSRDIEQQRKLVLQKALADDKLREQMEGRMRFLLWIFLQYGNVERVKLNVERKFLFVVYYEKRSASNALAALQSNDTRLRHIATLRAYCEELAPHAMQLLPASNFYCRIPKNYVTQPKRGKGHRHSRQHHRRGRRRP